MRFFVLLVFATASLPALATPPLFKATNSDHSSTLWLAGTVHLLERAEDATPPAFSRALDKADRVWFELDPGLPPQEVASTMFRLARDEPEKSLAALATDDETRTLLDDGKAAGFPVDPLLAFEPWFVMIHWNLVQMQRIGFDPNLGVERQYFQRAQQRELPIAALETVPEQAGYLDGIAIASQLAMLREHLDGLETSQQRMRDMVGAWREGDDAELARIIEESFEDDAEASEAIFYQRNANWAATLDREASEANELVMVGAGHLVGDRSLPEELRQLGWTVERVRE